MTLVNSDLVDFNQNKTSRLDMCLCGGIIIIIFLGCYLYIIPLLIGAGINYVSIKLGYDICNNITYWCYPLLGLGVYLILFVILVLFISSLICISKIIGCYLARRNTYNPVYVENNDYSEHNNNNNNNNTTNYNVDSVGSTEPVEEILFDY